MIDLHNHIVPAVDDGAADVEESLAIARQFLSEGVERIAATPHLDPERRNGLAAPEMRLRVESLQRELGAAKIALPVLPGHELYLTPDAPELLAQGRAAPLGSGPAVLVEVSFDQRPLYLEDTLFRLQLDGYRPVLAHPERYSFVQRDPGALTPLVDRGIVLQLTAPSLLGEYGPAVRRTAEKLLHNGLYTVAASDRHHPGPQRSLEELHARIVQLTSVDLADLLLRTNPERLISGQEPIPVEPRPVQNRSWFGRILGR